MSDESEKRITILKSLISETLLCVHREPPEGPKLEATARAWDSTLEEVPTHELDYIHRYAMRARPAERQSFPVTALDMRYVYEQRQRGLIYAKDQWLDETLYDEHGNYDPKRLVM